MSQRPTTPDPRSPQPKVIIITGCSSGFGLLTAAHLASKGHKVVATVRDLNRSGGLLDEVKRRHAAVHLLQLDVRDKLSVKNALADVGEKYGRIDVLINNAGFGLGGFFEDLTDSEIREQFETNFFGVQNVTRAVLSFMRPQRKGTIINISSIAGLSASPAYSAYNASKWALEAFSECLHYEVKPFGIHVCLIEPGTYKTKIFYENARYGSNFNNPDSPYYHYSQFLKKRVRNYVDDCHKNPEDIAALIEKIINSPNPAFRNIPDLESRLLLLLRKFLPFSLYSRLIWKSVFHGFKN